MSVPNLKRIALFVQKLEGGAKISKVGHVTLSHAHLGVILWSGRTKGPSSVSVPNLKRIALFFQKLLGGSQNFEIMSRDPKPRLLRGHFVVWTQ